MTPLRTSIARASTAFTLAGLLAGSIVAATLPAAQAETYRDSHTGSRVVSKIVVDDSQRHLVLKAFQGPRPHISIVNYTWALNINSSAKPEYEVSAFGRQVQLVDRSGSSVRCGGLSTARVRGGGRSVTVPQRCLTPMTPFVQTQLTAYWVNSTTHRCGQAIVPTAGYTPYLSQDRSAAPARRGC